MSARWRWHMNDSVKLTGALDGVSAPEEITSKAAEEAQLKATAAFNVGRFLFRYLKATKPWGRVESDQFASATLFSIEWLFESGKKAGVRFVLGKRALVVFF